MAFSSELLPEDFLNQYKNKKPNWGFNGLGEIVYYRTYSRIKEDGTNEEWWETIARCINGAQKIGAEYTKEEAQRLYDYIFNFKGCFAGRFLWQLGTRTVDELGLPSLQNCFSYETEIVTEDGIKQIGELENSEVNLMSENGRYINSKVKSYGKQKLYKLKLKRSGIEKEIFTTAEHRWFRRGRRYGIERNSNKNIQCSTLDLEKKDKLVSVYGQSWEVVSVEETDRIEKVFCAEVPETHNFVLEGNILTGNCWATKLSEAEDFCFLFDMLMLGGGVGFSVRREDVYELPRIKKSVRIKHKKTKDADFIVPDSRNGWVDLLRKVLNSFFHTGKGFIYSTILVRGAGEPIRGFGGLASGPQPLINGIDSICGILMNREGKKLRSIDVLDLANIIGSVVVSGNVRRCLPGNARIITDNGFKELKDVSIGDLVSTPNGFRPVINKFVQGRQNIIKVVTEDNILECTPNHKIAVTDGADSYFWKNAGDLSPGDKLLFNRLESQRRLTEEDIQLVPIEVIGLEKGEIKETFDIEVENDNCFFAEGILVHNSSQISLGDADDYLFLRAKRWDLGNIPNWRSMSNNTITADSFEYTSDNLWEGFNGNGEPYGLFNLKLTQKFGRLIDGPMKNSDLYPSKIDNADLTNPCFRGDTLIKTRDGLYPIEELVGQTAQVWDGMDWVGVSNFRETAENQELLEFTLHDGSVFHVTPYHNLILESGKKIEAQYIKEGDILQSSNSPECHGTIKVKGAYLKGFLVAEGSLSHFENGNQRPLLILYSTKYMCKQRLIDSAQELDGENFNTNVLKEIGFIKSGKNRERMSGLTPRKEELIAWCRDNKRNFPVEIYKWDKKSKLEFIAGVMDGDGCACDTLNGFQYQICSIHKSWLLGFQTLLKTFNLNSKIGLLKKACATDFNDGYGPYMCKDCYRLSISQKNSIGLAKEVRFSRLKSFADRACKLDIKSRATRVQSVKSIGPEPRVYCCTVNSTNTLSLGIGIHVAQCSEISIGNGEPCCLSELFLNNIDSKNELIDCAKLLYKTQKAISGLDSDYKKTNSIVQQNRRLGLGVTGICQSTDRLEWLDDCYRELRKFDKKWSKKRGWPESIKLTTCKPSGTLSLLSGSTPGIHPGYSKHYIRRVRMSVTDKLVESCKSAGYKVEFIKNFDGSDDHSTVVVDFLCSIEDNAILTKNITAVEQLELVKKIQTIWSDNAVSCTVYYKKEELPEIKKWLKENYEKSIKSISFLLHQDHGFAQAPYEEITEDKYKELTKNIKPIEFNQSVSGETLDVECEGGACPVK